MSDGTGGNNIAENLEAVRARIAVAAAQSGRKSEEITLVAVTKTRTPEEIEAVVLAGATDIGENKVQEITEKYDILRSFTKKTAKNLNIRWHMIGHLQRNKVKYIAEKVDIIHSVDSIRLAEEIDRRVTAANRDMDILIQVNAAGEDSKFGVAPGETKTLLEHILEDCGHLRVKGLMGIAPIADNPNDVRRFFSEMKALYDDIKHEYADDRLSFSWLSMGMTQDFEVAIEEGSNLVRVGTGIFGPRRYA
jgi:pyridoxal phosphate enzyme (YggS family)